MSKPTTLQTVFISPSQLPNRVISEYSARQGAARRKAEILREDLRQQKSEELLGFDFLEKWNQV